MVDGGEEGWKTDVVKVRQVRSDEQQDDISKNLFSFGQALLREECSNLG